MGINPLQNWQPDSPDSLIGLGGTQWMGIQVTNSSKHLLQQTCCVGGPESRLWYLSEEWEEPLECEH